MLIVKKMPRKSQQPTEPTSMNVRAKFHPLTGDILGIKFYIRGEAARLPSVSNSRLNWFPKEGTMKILSMAIDKMSAGFHNAAYATQLVRSAHKKLHETRVISGVAPEYRERLNVLTLLWNTHFEQLKTKLPLRCDKENRWVVTLHLADISNRMDTHNIQKGVLDWLQEAGVIKNDAHVDCFPTRNRDFNLEPNELIISLKPLEEETKELCKRFITHMALN